MPPPLASSTTLKRIHREIADLKKEDMGAIKLGPLEDNLFEWKATMPGPEGSVYEGGLFDVQIKLAHDYPFSAPHMTMRTRIYHMNINDRGGICIDILKHNWSPALSLYKVILSLSSLLTDPNPRDPLVPSIANEYLKNRAQHDKTARYWTQQYARPPSPPPAPIPVQQPLPNSSSKAKARALAATSTTPRSMRSMTRPSRIERGDPIVIDDSDDDTSRASRSTKRKRGTEEEAAGSSSRPLRRRTTRGAIVPVPDDEVIVIED